MSESSDESAVLTADDYQMAVNSMHAINSQATLQWLAEVSSKIAKECNSTKQFNRHPIIVVALSQLARLAGMYVGQEAFNLSGAYKICRDEAAKAVADG